MDRRKELLLQYKEMKHDMGIFIVRCKTNNKCHLQSAQNLRGRINRTRFQLEAGSYPYRELQKEWKDLGEENFTIEILEYLEYDKDESKTDYTEELALLQINWEEKLLNQKAQFYKR